ncbi:MAG: amidohydrolase family protein [Acidobacteriota bacterium]
MARRKPNEPETPKAPRVLLVRGARQLVTMRGSGGARRGAEMRALGIIPDGALLIVDGVIQEVGPSRRVEMLAAARDAEEIDASGKAVMPGFVDCQTHLLAPPAALDDFETRCLKGRFPDPTGNLIPNSEGTRVMRGYSAQRLEMEGKRQLRNVWRHGTTTLGSTSGAGLDEASELRALRVLDGLNERPLHIVRSFGGALGVSPEFAGRSGEYLAWLRAEMLPEVARRRLAHRVDVAIGDGAFELEGAAEYIGAALALGFVTGVRLRSAVDWVPEEAMSVSGVGYLQRCAERMAGSGTVAVLTPGVRFYRGGDALEPARELIDGGAAVALSTGFNPHESPTPSMPMAMSLACAQLRMTPAEALVAATINGAHALGVGSQAGSLEIGKWGDLLVLNASDYREIPLQFGVNLLMMALRRGQMIYPRLEAA